MKVRMKKINVTPRKITYLYSFLLICSCKRVSNGLNHLTEMNSFTYHILYTLQSQFILP